MSGLRGLMMCVLVLLLMGERTVHGQERIKLCGRDLVRLTVNACGNSHRYRRNTPELGESGSDLDMGIPTEGLQATPELPTSASQPDGEADDYFLGQHWYRAPSRVRRAAWKTPDVCCEKGCSLQELIQFC